MVQHVYGNIYINNVSQNNTPTTYRALQIFSLGGGGGGGLFYFSSFFFPEKRTTKFISHSTNRSSVEFEKS